MKKVVSLFLLCAFMVLVSCGTDPFFHDVKVYNGDSLISEDIVYDGDTFRFPDADGIENFIGWKISGEKTIYQPGDTIAVTDNIVIIAKLKLVKPDLSSVLERMSTLEKITVSTSGGLTVRYTLDGTDPGKDNGETGNEISLSSVLSSGENEKDVTIKVITIDEDGICSEISQKTVKVVVPPTKPSVSTDISSALSSSSKLTLPSLDGTTIRYAFGSAVPTSTTGNEAAVNSGNAEIDLTGQSGNVTVNIVRFDSYGIASEVETLNLKVKPAAPSLENSGTAVVSGAALSESDTVTIPSIEGTIIRYTTDGTDPSTSSSAHVGNSISLSGLSGSTTIKAVAVKDGVVSDVMSIDLTVKPAPFHFTAGSAEVSSETVYSQTDTIGVDVEGARIYYTTDGTTPSSSSTEAVDGNISLTGLSGSVTIKAIAVKDGTASDPVTCSIKVKPSQPSPSIQGRKKYHVSEKVTLPSLSDGCNLRYTIGASPANPTSESSTVAADGISLSGQSGIVTIILVSEKDGIISDPVSFTVNVCLYKLSFNLSGADSSSDAGDIPFNRGDSVTLPSSSGITKSGYVLDGWYTEADGNGTYHALSSSITLNRSSDMTLYAHWVDCDITFTSVTSSGSSSYLVSGKDGVTSIEIPSVYHGSSVTLNENAFKGNTSLETVSFDSSSDMTVIPSHAFDGCSSLRSINIPSSVTDISAYAFNGCTSLDSIVIPESVTEIGEYAFSSTGLKSAVLSDNVTGIGNSAFLNSSSLSSVSIGNSITSIGENAFKGCSSTLSIYIDKMSTDTTAPSGKPWGAAEESVNWKKAYKITFNMNGGGTAPQNIPFDTNDEVTLPEAVRTGWTFDGWYSGSKYYGTSDDSVTMTESSDVALTARWIEGIIAFKPVYDANDTSKVVSYEAWCGIADTSSSGSRSTSPSGTVKIPSVYHGLDVTGISENGFLNCAQVTGVEIPSTVTKIGKSAFDSCSISGKIEIPASVTEIGDAAFASNSSLTEFEFGEGTEITIIPQSCFLQCGITSLSNLPSTVKTIGESAFEQNPFETIVIPSSVETIGQSAFMSCENSSVEDTLKSVIIPDSVLSIGNYAFKDNTLLESVTIGDGVQSIGAEAFKGCSELRTVTIGSGINTISSDAFTGCNKLEEIDIDKKKSESSSFSSSSPWGSSSSSLKVDWGKEYILSFDSSELEASIEDIPFNTGDEVTLPSAIKSGSTFDGWYSSSSVFYGGAGDIVTITDSASVTLTPLFIDGTLSFNAVYDSSDPTKIVSYEAWCGITDTSESSRSSVTGSITIPSAYHGIAVTGIADEGFMNCSGVTNVVLPDTVTSIGENAFKNCTSLSFAAIPDSVTSIGSGAYSECTELYSVKIGSGITSIADNAFSSSGVESISIDRSIGTSSSLSSTSPWGATGADVSWNIVYICATQYGSYASSKNEINVWVWQEESDGTKTYRLGSEGDDNGITVHMGSYFYCFKVNGSFNRVRIKNENIDYTSVIDLAGHSYSDVLLPYEANSHDPAYNNNDLSHNYNESLITNDEIYTYVTALVSSFSDRNSLSRATMLISYSDGSGDTYHIGTSKGVTVQKNKEAFTVKVSSREFNKVVIKASSSTKSYSWTCTVDPSQYKNKDIQLVLNDNGQYALKYCDKDMWAGFYSASYVTIN